MIDLCKECFEEKLVGSFYWNDADPEQHLTGYVSALNEEEIVIAHISPNGFYDGFILLHLEDLFRVDIQGQYENRIARLYALRKQHHPELKPDRHSLYFSLLNYARLNGLLISAETEDNAVSGFLRDFDWERIRLEVIDENGRPDGETVIRTETVCLICVDTDTEQNRKLLYAEMQEDI